VVSVQRLEDSWAVSWDNRELNRIKISAKALAHIEAGGETL